MYMKAAIASACALLLAACSEKSEQSTANVQGAQAPAPAAAPTPVAKPSTMRAIDYRLKVGVQQHGSCNIESLNGVLFWPTAPTAQRVSTIEFGGWVVDGEAKKVPADVKLRIQSANGVNAWEQDVVTRVDRPDVAKNLKHEDFLKAGFKVAVDLPELAPGEYVVYLAYPTQSGGDAICGIGRRFTLT
ncbi:hypothetical protein [Lysobacter soli]|nr:hypothetical protein [Lysobacter soli]